jgi:hypothetical protein
MAGEAETLSSMGTGMSQNLRVAVEELAAQIEADGDAATSTIRDRLDLLQQLTEFSLGRFLITKGRLDAEHQFVVSTWPQVRASARSRTMADSLHPLERFLLEESPTMRAFQKRHSAMVAALPNFLAGAKTLAIVPGCLCEDLTELPDSKAVAAGLEAVYHVHVEASAASPQGTQANASAKLASTPFGSIAEAVTVESWESLLLPRPVDLIVTGTLAMNEPEITDIGRLYGQLHGALDGEKGKLITGFLTQSSNASASVVETDRMLFRDVIRTSWSQGRSADTVASQLVAAGFARVDIIDHNGSYGTALARA